MYKYAMQFCFFAIRKPKKQIAKSLLVKFEKFEESWFHDDVPEHWVNGLTSPSQRDGPMVK